MGVNNKYILAAFILLLSSVTAFGQIPLWKQALSQEEAGNYTEAIRLRKIMGAAA